MLEEVGLSPAEERAYRTLVRLAQTRPAELADHLGVDERESARLLTALARAGLAVAQADGDGLFRPLSPDVALGAGLLRRQQALEAARAAVAQLTEEYRTSARRHDAGQLVEIVHGRADLRVRLRHLQDTAQQEMLWFCRANHVAMASADNSEEFSALQRGVRYRVIYERALLEEPGMVENVAKGIHCGEEARALPTLPVRLAIADRSVAVCPLVPDGRSGEPTAAVVGRSQLLDALLALFESYWERASPVVLTGGDSEVDQPDAQERLLLSLFVAGLPDKAIASQLAVSRRTVQRRLWSLMARAGVDTRPGLAFQAARRGWV
jgi:DNA-binding CsgD family transcriptional regulator/DNA-binding MarR family transcriptional regulator